MNILLIIFVSISLLPVSALTNQTITKSDIDHLSNSIDELKNLLAQKQNEINDMKSLIETSDSQINSKLNEISNQDKSINQSLKTHVDTSLTFENIKNKISDLQFLNSALLTIATTLIGILVGDFISKRNEKRKRVNELKDAQQQMRKEFSRLHDDVWRSILDTREVIHDQHSGMLMINRLINRQTSVHDEFLQHIHGLHFILWDFTLPHMNQFTESEKDQLMRIHNFITGVNELLINHHHNVLNDRLQQILNSQSSNGIMATQMKDELIIDFNARMKIYGEVYRKIKNLNINWLRLDCSFGVIKEKEATRKETKKLIIHIAIMFSISLIFMIYFRTVEHNPELQQQIIDNASILPPAQLLAYGSYFVYVLLQLIPRYKEHRKIKRDLQNVIILIGRAVHEYVVWTVDLIGITITFYAFFIYSNPHPSSKILGIMDISDAYFLIMVPSLTILSHLLLSKRKLEYR